jgi:hypothetical protein
MNVAELHNAISAALARGLNPQTTVVIDMQAVTDPNDAVWPVLASVEEPTSSDEGYLWFTLIPSDVEADPRFTVGHES